MELSPSMADIISSSYESSSDRPLGDALLESDTHTGITPGTESSCRTVKGQAGPTEAQREQVKAWHGPGGQQPSRKWTADPTPIPRPPLLGAESSLPTTLLSPLPGGTQPTTTASSGFQLWQLRGRGWASHSCPPWQRPVRAACLEEVTGTEFVQKVRPPFARGGNNTPTCQESGVAAGEWPGREERDG